MCQLPISLGIAGTSQVHPREGSLLPEMKFPAHRGLVSSPQSVRAHPSWSQTLPSTSGLLDTCPGGQRLDAASRETLTQQGRAGAGKVCRQVLLPSTQLGDRGAGQGGGQPRRRGGGREKGPAPPAGLGAGVGGGLTPWSVQHQGRYHSWYW